MMDDLASPLERALIAYNHVERSLLQPPLRMLAPGFGAMVILASLALAWLIASGATRGAFTAPGAALHGALALIALGLGTGCLLRKAWAVLALYPVVVLLQAGPYLLLMPVRLFAQESARFGAWIALGGEALVLVALALTIARHDPRPGEANAGAD